VFDLVCRHGLPIDKADERLAMGSTTGSLCIGDHGGAQGTLISCYMPPFAQVLWSD